MLWLLLSHGRDKLWIFFLSFFKFWWLIAGAMKKWQVKNIDGWILFEYSANNGISLQKIDLCADCRPTMVSTQDDSLVTAGMQGAKTVEVRWKPRKTRLSFFCTFTLGYSFKCKDFKSLQKTIPKPASSELIWNNCKHLKTIKNHKYRLFSVVIHPLA